MKKSYSGFTLLELMISIACIAILTLIMHATWVYYGALVQRLRLQRQVTSALGFARRYAVSHRHNTIYCGSLDGLHCDGHWDFGQVVIDADTQKIQRVYRIATHSVALNYFANFGHNQQVEFNKQGFTHGQQGHFELCNKNPYTAYCSRLTLHFSGQVVIAHNQN